jgi:[protein-PII] uridylyltransferase
VRQHLLMSHISQRRDLSDEKVIRDFAAVVGTVERLDLLTPADVCRHQCGRTGRLE